MFFDCSVGDSAVYACIAPANKDWSILGLKHGDGIHKTQKRIEKFQSFAVSSWSLSFFSGGC